MDALSLPDETNTNSPFQLNLDPRAFRHPLVYAELVRVIHAKMAGQDTQNDPFCRCSYFPLDDLIGLGIRGELFADANGQNPLQLASLMTHYLWVEIVRLHVQSHTERDP